MSILRFAAATLVALAGLPVFADDPYVLHMTDASGAPGSIQTVQVLSDNPGDLQGWSFGVCHPSALLTADAATPGSATATSHAGGAPDFLDLDIYSDGVTMGVVVDFLVSDSLAAGTDQDLLDIDYELIGAAGSSAAVDFCETLGSPPVEVIVVHATVALPPTQAGGTVDIETAISGFRRGDFDGDSSTGMNDATNLLTYVTEGTGDPKDCTGSSEFESADVNDNEHVGLADYLALRHAVLNGTSIPTPSTGCGDDPTSDEAGFDAMDDDYRVTIGSVYLLPPAGPTNRRVGFPVHIESPVDVVGLSIAFQIDSAILHPFATNPFVGSGLEYHLEQDGDTLLLNVWATNDGDVLFNGQAGAFQNVGTLFMNLDDGYVFPPVDWLTDAAVGNTTMRATIIGTDFSDHHPELVAGEYEFARGDANSDDLVDLGDAIYIFAYLFTDGPGFHCEDAADSNNDSRIDLADGINILYFLFSGGPVFPQPYPQCGLDSGGIIDFLDCEPPGPGGPCL